MPELAKLSEKSNVRFAMKAVAIANLCSMWAHDALTFPDKEMSEEAARRFVATIRNRLEWIEDAYPNTGEQK